MEARIQGSREKKVIRTYKDLDVYQLSFQLAMEVFRLSKNFPIEERYNLTDQLRRAARSIPLNISEGWAKRSFEKIFKRHLLDAIGSCEEVKVCLNFCLECTYIDKDKHEYMQGAYARTGAMLTRLFENWKIF